MNFAHNKLRNFPTKFDVKFTTSFQSLQFDCQLRNEIANFIANFGNFKQTSENVVKSFVKRTVIEHNQTQKNVEQSNAINYN